MARFRIRATWADALGDEALSSVERRTFAQIEISVDETVLTRVSGPAERSHVLGPASGLAEWIVESWLPLLWESHTPFSKSAGAGAGRYRRPPTLRDALQLWRSVTGDRAALGRWQQRHTLGVASSDLALPSIVFLPEENAVGVFVAPMPDELEPAVELAAAANLDDPVWVRLEDMRETLGAFVDETIGRARGAGPDADRWATWLGNLWNDARHRERDPAERRKAALGDYAAQHWTEATAALDADVEALRGVLLDTTPVPDQVTWDRRLAEVAQVRGTGRAASVAWPRPVASGVLPFMQGYQLAVALRETLANPADPIDLRDAMDALGIGLARVDAMEFRSAAIRTSDGSSRVLLGREQAGLARERFAVAAAMGRLLGSPAGTPVGAAHGPASRVRETQRAGAFAAELLLPSAALKTKSFNGDNDLRDLCEDFGISYTAATRQVENRGRPLRAD
jgi:hypothetical protein